MGEGEGGDVKRHPEVKVMTALLGEVAAKRHFSRHAECEKRKPKKFTLSTTLARTPTDTAADTHGDTHSHMHTTFQPLTQKGGLNPSADTL